MKVLYSLLFMLSMFFFVDISKATHAAGTDLSYRWISDSTYEFTVVFYRNCGPGAAGIHNVTNIRARSSNLGKDTIFGAVRLPYGGSNVPPLEPQNMYNCTKSDLCYQEYVFRGNFTMPGRANDWSFTASICCRPNGNRSPYNITGGSQIVQATLNNLDFPDITSQNSSPFWHDRRPNRPGHLTDTVVNYLVRTLCVGNYYEVDMSTKEYDGDKVTYEFVIPSSPTSPVTYKNGYTFIYPMPTVNGLSINTSTGEIRLTPKAPIGTGVYAIAIKATEYRLKGGIYVKIGSVIREMTFWLDLSNDCVKDYIHPQDIIIDYGGGDTILNLKFKYGGQFNLVNCKSIDPTGKDFKITDINNLNNQLSINKATWNCQNGATSIITLHLDDPLMCGVYDILVKKGLDNNTIESECGFWEPVNSKAKLTVRLDDPIDIGIDEDTLTLCYPDSQLTLNTRGNSGKYNYVWKFDNTVVGSNTKSIVANKRGLYELIIIDSYNCASNDQVMVYIDTMPNIGNIFIDLYCDIYGRDKNMPKEINVKSADSGYVWQWYDRYGILIGQDDTLKFPALRKGETYTLKYVKYPVEPDAPSCIAVEEFSYDRSTYPPEDPLTVILDKNFGEICISGEDSIFVNIDDYNIRVIYAPIKYYWIGENLDTLSEDTTGFVITEVGMYRIYVKDKLGCWGMDKILVMSRNKDYCAEGVYAPNVFTPNGDGINETLYFLGLAKYPGSQLQIFDRWGNLIYSSQDYKNNWVGENNPETTYFFILKVNDNNGTVLKGNFSIFR